MAAGRREFLKNAIAATAALGARPVGGLAEPRVDRSSVPLQNAIHFGDRFVAWQSPYGGPDLTNCPYRTKGKFLPTHLHGTGPMTRALYRLYQTTGDEHYKNAADRYAVFHLNTLRDPYEPHRDEEVLYGEWRNLFSRSWVYGKGLAPCYEEFRLHHSNEDAFDVKAYSIHRWLQNYRRPDSYFGIGYPSGSRANESDGHYSCDLGEVGYGLVGFYNATKYQPALDDATGLARYFLTDWKEGSAEGVWSPKLGTWLVGPWPTGGGEHFTDQTHNTTGWVWSSYVCSDYLVRLRSFVQEPGLKSSIEEKTVRAFQWCYDACQFDDGAVGMFGRDDKWVGMAAASLLLYSSLKKAAFLPENIERQYRPKVEKTWRWLVENTRPEVFPKDGYVRVSGTTTTKPLENIVWALAWTVEALLEVPAHFTA